MASAGELLGSLTSSDTVSEVGQRYLRQLCRKAQEATASTFQAANDDINLEVVRFLTLLGDVMIARGAEIQAEGERLTIA